jgi:hypothetical protein
MRLALGSSKIERQPFVAPQIELDAGDASTNMDACHAVRRSRLPFPGWPEPDGRTTGV